MQGAGVRLLLGSRMKFLGRSRVATRSGQGRSALWCAGENPAPVQGETLGRSKVQPWPSDVLPATHCTGLLSVALRNKSASPVTLII